MRSPWYPVLMFLIGLRNRLEPGQSISVDYLKTSLRGAIGESDRQIRKLGGSLSIQRDDSLYAVVSLADELVGLSKLDKTQRLDWEGEPLEYEVGVAGEFVSRRSVNFHDRTRGSGPMQ